MAIKKKSDRIVLFTPICGSFDIGDQIISIIIEKEMEYLFKDSYIVRYSSHNPVSKIYQNIFRGPVLDVMNKARYKFFFNVHSFNKSIGKEKILNIPLLSMNLYKNSILIGCQLNEMIDKNSVYNNIILKRTLNKEMAHSVNDDRTREYFESLNLKAINTGCPILWGLSDELCKSIPIKKSKNRVVFTLNRCIDKKINQTIVDVLLKNYKKVYFFPQLFGDEQYIKIFNGFQQINILKPNLKDYEKILKFDIDYVGTHLFSGIYALMKKRRAIIISCDSLTKEIVEKHCIHHVDIMPYDQFYIKLESKIRSSFKTAIKINQREINIWKGQFK